MLNLSYKLLTFATQLIITLLVINYVHGYAEFLVYDAVSKVILPVATLGFANYCNSVLPHGDWEIDNTVIVSSLPALRQFVVLTFGILSVSAAAGVFDWALACVGMFIVAQSGAVVVSALARNISPGYSILRFNLFLQIGALTATIIAIFLDFNGVNLILFFSLSYFLLTVAFHYRLIRHVLTHFAFTLESVRGVTWHGFKDKRAYVVQPLVERLNARYELIFLAYFVDGPTLAAFKLSQQFALSLSFFQQAQIPVAIKAWALNKSNGQFLERAIKELNTASMVFAIVVALAIIFLKWVSTLYAPMSSFMSALDIQLFLIVALGWFFCILVGPVAQMLVSVAEVRYVILVQAISFVLKVVVLIIYTLLFELNIYSVSIIMACLLVLPNLIMRRKLWNLF